MPDVELRGCWTRPLLSYLKTLGVFRHVAKADDGARLWWNAEGFALIRSRFDRASLAQHLFDGYAPTAITSPWNGGSGYYDGDNVTAMNAIEASASPRFSELRSAIAAARALVAPRGSDKPSKDDKLGLIELWRATCPDAALDWLDAAVVLDEGRPSMNPLLGTGGNDGNFEFSNNFLGRLTECLPEFLTVGKKHDASQARLAAALFGGAPELTFAAIGMFDPSSAGLPNSSSSASEKAIVNPWEFIFLLEGAALFGGAVARRLDATRASFPFTVREPSRSGASMQPEADKDIRGETWLPVWSKPSSLASLRRLLSEGRTQDGRRQARTGRHMLRAALDVGIDRGVDGFERVVFAQRYGLSYVAVSAGRVDVRRLPDAALTRSADVWLDHVRRVASAAIRGRVGSVDRCATEMATAADVPAALERWLLALADTELALAKRSDVRDASQPEHIWPLGRLDRQLITRLPDSVEHRLARALAAVGRKEGEHGLRDLLEPVIPTRGGGFRWDGEVHAEPLSARKPEEVLVALALRGSLATAPDDERVRLPDVLAFLAEETDNERVLRLAQAFTCCLPCRQKPRDPAWRPHGLDRVYALTRLATLAPADRDGGKEGVNLAGLQVVKALAGGNTTLAVHFAARRLRASEHSPVNAVVQCARTPLQARRIAAALAFPLHTADQRILERAVLLDPAVHLKPQPQGVPA